MRIPKPNAGRRCLHAVMVALALATLSACILDVEYARRRQSLVPHEGKALVFTRIRFFYEGREFLPWDSPALVDVLFDTDRDDARHIWLRRLDVTEASWELHPDGDGLLAIWLPAGDYALFGTEDNVSESVNVALTAVALLRVPADQPVVYAGELLFRDEWREGGSWRYTFGEGRVTIDSEAAVAKQLEARYGALPGPPLVSPWCIGTRVPSAEYNPDFVSQSRRLLDQGCSH